MRLINGNCIDELALLPDNGVDVTLTSPPYNMNLRIRGGKYCSRQITKELSTKYCGYDDNLPMGEYYKFNVDVLTELLRVSGLVFYNVQFLTGNKPALFKLMGEFSAYMKEFIVWDKVNSQPAIGNNIMNSRFEVLLVLSKHQPESRSFKSAQFDRGKLENLWQIKRGKKKHASHGATFPEELVSKVLDNFAPVGGTVLDPFMGTGTTGVVCAKSGYQFIGIELLPHYYDIARHDINEAKRESIFG